MSTIHIEDLKLSGTPKLHPAENGKRPFVFLAYAACVLVIETVINGTLVELRFALQSVALRQWENGFDVSFPSTPYQTDEGTRYARKVRPANRETRVELERAFRKDESVAKLIELGSQMLSA
jgi:hypothetical protein